MSKEELWLDFLKKLQERPPAKETVSHTTITKVRVAEKPLIEIPIDKLFEFYGNLVLAGFSEDEALVITCSVVNNARTV